MRCTPDAVAAALAEIDAQQRRRARVTLTPATGPGGSAHVVRDGRRFVNFASNDYLGLASHPAAADAMAAAARQCGVGSGASHLVTGHGPEHEALEIELAEFMQRERAVLFSTGYMANLGIACALLERGDLALQDRLNHASLLDAPALARGARLQRYPHLDAAAASAALAAHLAAQPRRAAALFTDGVFSMDGDIAPLPALGRAAAAAEAWLVVDDAHAFGVLGAGGRGSCEHFGLDARAVPLVMGTLGKALGSFGAFVCGDRAHIELLIQRARTYIYTTALPQPVAAATRANLRALRAEPQRRARLFENIARFRERALRAGIPLAGSTTPIQPLVVGSAEQALAASAALADAGYWVTAIRPPTVPEGAARLRITLSAAHGETEIDGLVDALARVSERAAA